MAEAWGTVSQGIKVRVSDALEDVWSLTFDWGAKGSCIRPIRPAASLDPPASRGRRRSVRRGAAQDRRGPRGMAGSVGEEAAAAVTDYLQPGPNPEGIIIPTRHSG